jgi:hypothetical protein
MEKEKDEETEDIERIAKLAKKSYSQSNIFNAIRFSGRIEDEDSRKRYTSIIEDLIIDYVVNVDPTILRVQEYDDEQNLGMVAIEFDFTRIATRSFYDKVASLQRDALGRNMGMIAVLSKENKFIEMALKNKELCAQKDKDGRTIYDYIESAITQEKMRQDKINKEKPREPQIFF